MSKKHSTSISSPFLIRHAVLTTFIVNACVMTLELVAGRIIAPYVGVSLYTWTGIIGIVLLGMSMGSYLGGIIADKNPSRNTLAFLLLGASVLCFFSLFLILSASTFFIQPFLPYILQVLIISSFFILPAILLGTISPVLIKLSLHQLEDSGKIVGKIYAAAALGSIVGTYATGFFLIAFFGTRLIVIAISLVLLLISLSFFDRKHVINFLKKRKVMTVFLFIGFLSLTLFIQTRSYCHVESNYYCIKVSSHNNLMWLVLNKLVHSQTDLNNPKKLQYEYEQMFAAFYKEFAKEKTPTLFLGGGGYTLQRYLLQFYKNPNATVVEIDPIVSDIAFEKFGMPRNSSVKTKNLDARIFVQNLSSHEKYKLIFADAFSDVSIPYHLTTKEFNEMIAQHLMLDGVYVINIIDMAENPVFLSSMIKTLSLDFPSLYLYKPILNEKELHRYRTTYVVAASHSKISAESILTRMRNEFKTPFKLYSDQELAKLLNNPRTIVLTDDYVPVDNMITQAYTNL